MAVAPFFAAAAPALPPLIWFSMPHISAMARSLLVAWPARSFASITTVPIPPVCVAVIWIGKARAPPVIGCSISIDPYSASSAMMS